MTLLTRPAASAATPLLSLTAVAFDTEATSLDVRSGRVIEFGAVALINGSIDESLTFSSLVNPGVAVPENATRIHGLTTADLKDADAFKDVHKQFRAFCGPHLLLGYSLDYDLNLLMHEHARTGLTWKWPVALDVRQLVQVLSPTLPDHALETVASWCGVAVENRHRALADAVLTAKVFLALMPHLRERNIRTLAEAMSACRKIEERDRPGLGREETEKHLPHAMMKADSYPYRHRIEAVMASPPICIPSHINLGDAMTMMVERRVSSLFVEPGREAGSNGVITERDVLRSIVNQGAACVAKPVSQFASYPLKTVRQSDFLHVAMGAMRRHKIRHLGVTDERGVLVGAVSQRDLLRLRADEALALSGAMSEAATPAELADVWRRLADAASALMAEDVEARDVAAIISAEVCALTARAAAMAETEVALDYPRPADLSYAVMVLGSGGRGESLLALDQDNAMIFDAPDPAAADAWLLRVATRMNDILDIIGVPYCKGGVMAKNNSWRMSVTDWRTKISHWLQRTNPADVMNADIFFDGVAVHGDTGLAGELRDHAIAAAAQSQAFLKLMSLAAADTGSAFNWLGRFSTDEQGRLDLKRLGIMPIFTAARAASLRHQIHARSTRERLSALRGNPDVPQQQLEALSEAHGQLLEVILRQQLEDIQAGIPPSNRVDPKSLSALGKKRLTWALQQVKSVADVVDAPLS